MKRTTAAVLGMITCTIIPGTFIVIAEDAFNPEALLPLWILLIFAYVSPALFVAVLGIPSFLMLRLLDLARWWSTSLVGFFIGVIHGMVMKVISIWEITVCGVVGVVTAGAFWLIWKRGVDSGVEDLHR